MAVDDADGRDIGVAAEIATTAGERDDSTRLVAEIASLNSKAPVLWRAR